MGRNMRYPVGSTVNGYKIAAREPDSRVAWVECSHPNCTQVYKVQMSNVIHAQARRFCAAHQVEERQRRTMQRMQDRQIKRNIAAAEAKALDNARGEPNAVQVVGKVAAEMTPMREMLDTLAVRTAWDRAGLRWRGHINDGKCFGWFVVDCRELTEGNAVRWRAYCVVCGMGRKLYDAQLKRGELNRCRFCTGSKERFEIAKRTYRKAIEKGIKMDQPDVLLRVAAWLADKGFDDDGCRTWTRDATVTFDEMLRLEVARLRDDTPEPVEVVQEKEEDIDWWAVPYSEWPTPVLLAMEQDMGARRGAYAAQFGVGWMMKWAEVSGEIQRRKGMSNENA